MWIVALVLTLATVDGPTASLETLDGAKLAGRLIELSLDGATIETAAGRKTLPLDNLLELLPDGALAKNTTSAAVQYRAGIWLELVDGSTLFGSGFFVKGPSARLTLLDSPTAGARPAQTTIEIPTRQIASVRLQPQSEETASEWKRIRNERAEDNDTSGDLLIVRKGSALDYHHGVVGDVSEKTVNFNLDGDVLPVRRGKVFAVIYQHTGGHNLPSTSCHLVGVDGSCWAVHAMEMQDDVLSFETPCGLDISLPLAAIDRLDFSRGKVVYLGDLTPQSADWTPYFSGAKASPARRALFGPRTDRGVGGEPIRLGGKEFSRGIILHSRSELVYRLDDDFRRFRATAGIDDSVRPRGHVQLIVRGDDRVLLDTTISGSEPPRLLDIDLGKARTLTIVVDYGNGLDVGDHLDLGDARVVK